MRLLNYLEKAPLTPEANTFRAMSIKLTDKPRDYSPILNVLKESSKIDNIIRRINIELKSVYTGKYSLALCLEEGIQTEKIKLKDKCMEKLKELLYESNTELAKFKESIEQNQ